MALFVPQVDQNTVPLQQFQAPETKDYASAQAMEQGAAMVKLGDVVTKVQNNLDDAQVRMQINADQEQRIKIVEDYKNLWGEDAVKAAPGVMESLKQIHTDGEQNMTNDVQRYMYKYLSNRQNNRYTVQAQTHFAHQSKVFKESTIEGTIDLAVQDGVNYAYAFDPSKSSDYVDAGEYDAAHASFNATLENIKSTVDQCKDLGWSPQQIEAEKIKELTKFHTNNIDALLLDKEEGPKVAKAYFEQYKDQISRPAGVRIEHSLKASSHSNDGLSEASERWNGPNGPDALVAADPDKYKGNKFNFDLGTWRMQQEKEIKEKYADDAETRHAALAELRDYATTYHQAKIDNDTGISARIRNKFGETYWNNNRQIPLSVVKAEPGYANLSDDGQDRLLDKVNAENRVVQARNHQFAMEQKQLNALRQKAANDKFEANASDTYNRLIANPRMIAEMPKADFEALQNRIYDSQFKDLVARRDKIMKNSKALNQEVLTTNFLNPLLEKAGITSSSDQTQYRGAVSRYIANAQKSEDHLLRPEEIQSYVIQGLQEVAINVNTSRSVGLFSWNTGNETAYKRRIDVQNQQAILPIPEAFNKQVDAMEAKTGRKVSVPYRQAMYAEYLKTGGK